jgi:hypothetical protein
MCAQARHPLFSLLLLHLLLAYPACIFSLYSAAFFYYCATIYAYPHASSQQRYVNSLRILFRYSTFSLYVFTNHGYTSWFLLKWYAVILFDIASRQTSYTCARLSAAYRWHFRRHGCPLLFFANIQSTTDDSIV